MKMEGPHLENISEAIMREVEQELWAIGSEIEALAVKYLDEHNVNYNADLRNSITSEVQRKLAEIELKVGPNVEYAIYVHEGTRPHWPPVKPIRKWVIKKLGIKGKEVDSVTFLVRRKIGRSGTEPRPFMLGALKVYEKQIARRIANAVARGLKRGVQK